MAYSKRPQDLTVINMWGGPGAGKSTTAAGLFYEMKRAGYDVELITEYAKDLTYDGHRPGLGRQLEILGEQDARQRRVVGHARYLITDSPLPTGLVYAGDEYLSWLTPAVMAAFERYDNINILLRRANPYNPLGRNQTEKEARDVDYRIANLFAMTPLDSSLIVMADKFATAKALAFVRLRAQQRENADWVLDASLAS